MGVARVRPHAVGAGERHGVKAFTVRFVGFETADGQRADVDGFGFAIRHEHGEVTVKITAALAVVAVAIAVVLHGHVSGERVAAVGPPKCRAVVGVERQHLVG